LRLPEEAEVFLVCGPERVERALQGGRKNRKAQAFGGVHSDIEMRLAIGKQIADGAEFIYSDR
jgi:hypothetical protein